MKASPEKARPAPAGATDGSGFTFLEIMVALSVIAIVLVSVYKMQSQTLAMSAEKRFYTTAPLLAAGKLAQLEVRPLSETGPREGDFGENFPDYRWSVDVQQVESEFLSDDASKLVRIDMDVAFHENQFVYHLRTYRFLQP